MRHESAQGGKGGCVFTTSRHGYCIFRRHFRIHRFLASPLGRAAPVWGSSVLGLDKFRNSHLKLLSLPGSLLPAMGTNWVLPILQIGKMTQRPGVTHPADWAWTCSLLAILCAFRSFPVSLCLEVPPPVSHSFSLLVPWHEQDKASAL